MREISALKIAYFVTSPVKIKIKMFLAGKQMLSCASYIEAWNINQYAPSL